MRLGVSGCMQCTVLHICSTRKKNKRRRKKQKKVYLKTFIIIANAFMCKIDMLSALEI